MNCPNCNSRVMTTPAEHSIGMCTTCANVYGVMPMLPARRPPRPCQHCNGMQFIRAVPRELTATPGEYGSAVSSPMAVTFLPEINKGWFSSSATRIDSRQAFGLLEIYICRGCGLVEWYCNDPERIPIGPAYMTEAIDYGASDTPYRG